MKFIYNYSIFIVALFSVVSVGCKQKSVKVQPTIPTVEVPIRDSVKPTEITNSTLITPTQYSQMVTPIRVNVETLEGDGTARIDTKDENLSFSFKLRMIKDSVIWFQLKKLGLEGVRAMATPTRLVYIDRLHRTYTSKEWSELAGVIKAPITFTVLQDILLGNPPAELDGPINISQSNGQSEINAVGGQLVRILLAGTDGTMNEMSYQNVPQRQIMNLKINDKKLLYDNVKFSYLRDLEILLDNIKQLYVSLEFDQVKPNITFSIPFEVPANYRRVD